MLGCGGAAPPPAAAAATTTFAAQVDVGKAAYGAKCASCHGAGGEGGDGPRLVGLDKGALPLEPKPGAKRATRFVTAADVADYVVKAMPADAPGTLAADEAFAILAFDLSANGVSLDKKLGPDVAKTLTIPR